MAIVVRQADIERDRGLLIQAVATHINASADRKRFDWLYIQNPAGRALAWIATDEGTGDFVGMASAFPRRVALAGGESLCWVLGDFCIHDRYRSLGPALQLQRAIIEESAAKKIAFWYDFPSVHMTAVYRRLRIDTPNVIVRMSKVLRVDRKLQGYLPWSAMAKWIARPGNVLVRALERSPRISPDIAITVLNGPCREEFSKLAADIGTTQGACLVRSADYLNWRYRAGAVQPHEILTAHRAGRLVGYLVFTQEADHGIIMDLFGRDTDALGQLICEAVNRLRTNGAMAVSAPISQMHPLLGIFRSFGFVAREQLPMVCQPGGHASMGNPADPRPLTMVMSGERDC